MNATTIELYDMLRYDLNLPDNKSRKFMSILDSKYASNYKEDFVSLSQQMTEQISGFSQRMDEKISGVSRQMDEQIAGVSQRMDEKIAGVSQRMDEKISGFSQRIDGKISEVSQRIDEKISEVTKQMSRGFQRMDDNFERHGQRLDDLEGHIVRLDNKIDVRTNELRVEIRDSKVEAIRWTLGIFLAIILMILAGYLKK